MSPPPVAHEQMPYHQGYQPRMPMGQSGFMPMYQGNMAMPQPQAQYRQDGSPVQQMSQAEQEKMEAAFEQALADAREQSTTTTKPEEGATKDAEPPAEEMRETKGDLEAVWESLRPEAERLNKLAEWERDFSQVRFFCRLLDQLKTVWLTA